MKLAHITDPIYTAAITIIYATPEEVAKATKRHVTLEALDETIHDIGPSAGRCMAVDHKGTRHYIIHIHSGVKKDQMDTIYHEAFHCTVGIFRDLGLSLSRDSEEAYAYHQGWLAKEVLKVVKK